MKKILLICVALTLNLTASNQEELSLYCEEGDTKSCFSLKMITDEQKCENGDTNSCFRLALIYQKGIKVKQDYEKSFKLYSIACDKGDAQSCNNLGVLYRYGYGVPMDYKTALKFVKKACKLKKSESENGCINARILESVIKKY